MLVQIWRQIRISVYQEAMLVSGRRALNEMLPYPVLGRNFLSLYTTQVGVKVIPVSLLPARPFTISVCQTLWIAPFAVHET